MACRDRDVLLHVDACQGVGQVGTTLAQLGADLLSASGAKFGGVAGTGMLVLGPRGRLAPVLEGDDREHGRRAGRPDVAAIAATAVALHAAVAGASTERSHREALRRQLREELAALDDVVVHGPLAESHPGIVAASALYVDGEALVTALDERGFAVHSGSSCTTTSGEPSHVLVAMQALTHGHVRVSLGPETSDDDLAGFVAAYRDCLQRLRRAARAPR